MADIRLLELRNTYKWGGGPDKTILLSAEQHDRALVNVIVAYIRDARDHEFCLADKAKARGLTCYEIEERGKLDLRVLGVLQGIVLRHDINLIHAHDYKSDMFAYFLRRRLRHRQLALVSTAHAWVMTGFRGEVYKRLDMLLMRRFNHLIAVSHATKNEMVTGGVRPEMISVIHNAIDIEVWSPEQAATTLKEELGLEQSFPIIGYVGRIMPEKDLETWLRAASIVARQYPEARFVLVGEGRDGVTLRQLQRLAADLDIADRVYFPGYKANLLPVYATFDLFFLSSRREGLPNSILEAMAMGLPVVTTDVAGTKELVVDGRTGYVLQQGDVEGLARAMMSLAGNGPLRQEMGRTGRERIESQFSFTNRLRCIEALYAKVLDLPLDRVLRTDSVSPLA